MATDAGINSKPPDYQEAQQLLASWIAGAQALSLLQNALQSGIFDAVREPGTISHISTLTGLDKDYVTAMCRALIAHRVFELNDNQEYYSEPTFALLSEPDATFLLQDTVEAALTRTHLLEQPSSNTAYSNLKAEVRLALARGDTINPLSNTLQNLSERIMQDFMPEWKSAFIKGGRHLELGCGVGGGLLSLIYHYPKMNGVGVDINPAVLEVARLKAEELGVAERVEWWLKDARTIKDDEAFDTVFWSQSYFPFNTRVATLQVTLKALKPGGLLYAPVDNLPESPEELHSPSGRRYSLTHLLRTSWGLPEISIQNLQKELEEAGFELIRVIANPFNQGVLVKRP